MKQHKYLFVLLFSIFFCAVQAQNSNSADTTFKPTFHQESGFTVYLSPYAIIPVATYWGRVNFLEPQKELSVSASIPISLGGRIGTFGGLLVLDVPLTVDVNIGDRSTKKATSKAGAFVGAGGGFNLMLGNGYVRSFGPLTHAGLRVTSPFTGRSGTLRFSYLLGIGGTDGSG
ncbi:MAG: hypothetical protein ACO3EE_11115, partial [Flavobacteriales bacterium]